MSTVFLFWIKPWVEAHGFQFKAIHGKIGEMAFLFNIKHK